jgi:two-component system nitrate/nitrite response regulator NarL
VLHERLIYAIFLSMQLGCATASVLIVEDHPLYRYALEQTVASDARLSVCGSYADGIDGLDGIIALRPDVALVDLELPRLSGMEIVRTVAGQSPETRTLVLSAASDGASIYAALEAGAAGYMTKEIEPGAICMAILAAAEGETVVPRGLQATVAREIRLRLVDAPPALTARERDIVALAARGCSSSRIGRDLHVSEGTVKTHLTHVYEKLGVSDRAAAVAQAMKYGLVQVD